MQLTRLFEPYQMGRVRIANRIVFAGHGSRFVDPHSHDLTSRQAAYLAERAKGGVGLIIQGSSIVHPTGLATGGINQLWDDSGIPAYARVTEAVHREGAAIFGQLSHLGRQGHTFTSHRELWAPSAAPDPSSRVVPHAMTKRDIREMIDSYRQGARRLLEAGFDGLEVYMGHGYLLCSFLSRFSNTRTDEWGGSLENRMRLPLACLEAVREVAGNDVPVGIRISAEEFVNDGLHPEESKEITARLLEAVPTHFVSVSQSNYVSIDTMIPDMSFPRAPFVGFAGDIRKVCGDVPVFAVARIVDPEKGEEILQSGMADFICLVRPLIADPELPNKAREGRFEDIRRCISCNVGCRGGPHRGVTIACLVNPAVGFEADYGIGKIKPATTPKYVVIVGGGPGGLKAAETAASRGHRVTLIEASDRLGGTVNIAAAAMPYRDELANSTRFMERECRRLGVDIRLNTRADAAMIRALRPDAVITATGSLPGMPDIPGVGQKHVFNVTQAITEGVGGAKNVLVVDSGQANWRFLTTAENVAARGAKVTMLTPVTIGAEVDAFSRPPFIRRLGKAGMEFLEHHALLSIGADTATVRDNWTGREQTLPVDAVVLAWYGIANDSLSRELEDDAFELHVIGDALAPRLAIDAIWDGFRIGVAL